MQPMIFSMLSAATIMDDSAKPENLLDDNVLKIFPFNNICAWQLCYGYGQGKVIGLIK